MFAAHPAISCLPETSYLRRYVARSALQSIYRSSGLQSAIDLLGADTYFARTRLQARDVISEALRGVGQLDALVYTAILKAMTTESSAYVVDKDPRMIEFLPLLKVTAQDARVINVIRDPRDVLASKKKAAWSKSGHAWKHIFANRVQLAIGRKQGAMLFGVNYHEVIYEELISSPERVLSHLCDKLNLNYTPSMMNFGEAAKRLVAHDEMSWKKETLGRLLDDNKGKWRQALACKEIRLTEICCGEAMRAGAYAADRACSKLGTIDWLWVLTGRLLILGWTHPYCFYRKQTQKIK